MLSVAEASARILAAFEFLEREKIPLAQSRGRVLAQDIVALRTHPPFAMSAMDGYAIRSADIPTLPARLRVIGESAAGNTGKMDIGPGECIRIFTGAPLPSSSDCIVIQENCERQEEFIVIREGGFAKGQFVRPAGLDFIAGTLGYKAGQEITARDIGLIAAMNYGALEVARKPHIAIISTGNELIEPGQATGLDLRIPNSNAYALAAFIEALGGTPHILGIARDEMEHLTSLLGQGQGHDLLITIGGASVGEHDLVKKALSDLGLKLDFWKIAMRPGKPLLFGKWLSMPVLGLPGNPVSVMITALIFLKPAIEKMLGLSASLLPPDYGILEVDLPANDSRQDYLRSRIIETNGVRYIRPFSKQDSSMLRPLAQSDCLAIRPPHAPAAKRGERIEILTFPSGI